MNENKENNTPNEDFEGKEDTKAFYWEYLNNTDGVGEEPKADENAGGEEPKTDENADGEEPKADENADGEEPKADENAGGEEPKADENADGETSSPKKHRRDRALPISCILSALSIALLIAFSLSLLLGIFPLSGREVVILTTSDAGATEPDIDAQPELIEDFLNSVVVVMGKTDTGTSTGTGVIISEDGFIITNYHVLEKTEPESINVRLYGEDVALKAKVIGFHADDDVAVIKIDRTGLRAAVFADSDSVRYGEKVYAIGNPEGVEFSWSVTQGIVSCPLRELVMYDSEGLPYRKMNVVQTDASVNHGNSGGPLINVRGEVVGIVTLKRSDSAGMGFALPANGVMIDVAAIIANGHANNVSSGISVPRPLLGVTGRGIEGGKYYKYSAEGLEGDPVTDEYAKANPSKVFFAAADGVYVSEVSSGSDAAKHLRKDDIITEVNGTPVTTIYDVMNVVNRYNGGDSVTVRFFRDGKYHSVSVELHTAKDVE